MIWSNRLNYVLYLPNGRLYIEHFMWSIKVLTSNKLNSYPGKDFNEYFNCLTKDSTELLHQGASVGCNNESC